jgi:hypothetical protein
MSDSKILKPFPDQPFFQHRVMPDGHFVKGSIALPDYTIEAHKNFEVQKSMGQKRTILAAADVPQREVDLDFLPAAAEAYHLSPNAEDYIIVSLPIVTADIPNRNLQCFALGEISTFDSMHGRMVYQTFLNKPCHVEHANEDPTKAKGVHLDASMQYVPKYGLWKINVLTMWDRTKDPKLVEQILSGERNGYSMGALVDAFQCSICGAADTITNPCKHMRQGKGTRWKDVNTQARGNEMGRLCYQLCCGSTFFETSSVLDPADASAKSSDVFV